MTLKQEFERDYIKEYSESELERIFYDRGISGYLYTREFYDFFCTWIEEKLEMKDEEVLSYKEENIQLAKAVRANRIDKYNKAIDDCIAILIKYQNGCAIHTLKKEMEELKSGTN